MEVDRIMKIHIQLHHIENDRDDTTYDVVFQRFYEFFDSDIEPTLTTLFITLQKIFFAEL